MTSLAPSRPSPLRSSSAAVPSFFSVHLKLYSRPSGGFAGTYTSPNGLYRFAVTNSGIVLDGPGGKLVIDRALLRLVGEPWLTIEGAQTR